VPSGYAARRRATTTKPDNAKRARGALKVGLCGFTMSISEYFETFRVLEVQQTFYEPPQDRTLAKWRAQAGPSFEFTLKAWQLVTHRSSSTTYRRLRTPLTKAELADAGAFRGTETVRRGRDVTLACAKILRATAILFQCPASFRHEPENVAAMRRFFEDHPRTPGVRLLWEPRGPWPDDAVLGLCKELDLVHVVDPFVRPTLTPELTYWRLHGLNDHRRPYTDEELAQVLAWSRDGTRDVSYVMFNEIPRIGDSRRFMSIVRDAR